MESLLCDEVLVLSPLSAAPSPAAVIKNSDAVRRPTFFRSTAAVSSRNDFEEAVGFLVEKEMSYMPKPGYVNRLESNTLIYNARSKAIHWIIESQKMLNVSMESAFYAANYLDRFISLNKCQGWRSCMFDLLSVSCLYVASKFNETCPPSLHALQMEGLGHPPFGSNLIGRMEMSLLQALGWKLLSTTPYSYLQLMETIQDELKTRATHMLLQALLDPKFLEFRPSFVAEATLRCTHKEILPQENNQCFHHFTALIPQDQKNDMMMKKCDEMMEKGLTEEAAITTTKKEKQYELCGSQETDCPVLRLQQLAAELNIDGSTKKRKRDTVNVSSIF